MICDRCGKNVSQDSLGLHERSCGGLPHSDTPEEIAAHRALLDEIGALVGHGRAPTKGELRRAAINAIMRARATPPAASELYAATEELFYTVFPPGRHVPMSKKVTYKRAVAALAKARGEA